MKAIVLAIAMCAWATPLLAIDFSHYHSQDEINEFLRDTARAAPEFAHFHNLGYSDQGREINYLVLAKGDPDALPAVYLNGTHHGNEKSSTETVLGVIDYLVKHRTDPEVARLVETYAFYLQPMVNPDGHAADSRGDALGRDPNRDYAFPERGDDDSFKIAPVRLVKELVDKVHFRAAIALHSGMEGVLWPWCFSPQRSPEADTFYTLSKLTAEAMGMQRFAQSYRDYPTRGEFIDYAYMTHGTLAVTIEVSSEGNPAATRLAYYVQRGILGALVYYHGVMQLDEGLLEIKRAPDTRGVTVASRGVAARSLFGSAPE